MKRRQFLGLVASGILPITGAAIAGSPKIPETDLRADALIVGSGPAGLSIADALSRAGRRVVVLESGVETRNSRYQRLSTVLDGGTGLPYDIGFATQRRLGGTTALWGGLCPRMTESDLRTRALFGYGTDWPMDYADLSRYYCAAERWLRVGVDRHRTVVGNVSCDSAIESPFGGSSGEIALRMRSLGINGAHGASVSTRPDGGYSPVRLGRDVAPQLRSRANLTIVTGATVRRVMLHRAGVARGVVFSGAGGEEQLAEADVVVLAAGAVQNARLLLLSENGAYPNGIGNESGHVGRWFMEHPHRRFWLRRTGSTVRGRSTIVDIPYWYDEYRRRGRGGLWVRFSIFDQTPAWTESPHAEHADMLIDCLCEQEPASGNRLILDRERADALGDLLPRLSFQLGKREHETLDSVSRSVEPLLNLGTLVGEDPLAFGAHLMGTTRMSRRAADGVVDGDLQVHGFRNLYLAGASVFCTGAGVNPTLTLTALSLRLADHLVNRGQRGVTRLRPSR